MMKRHSRMGFTLIELLVVITIIGLLMALLFSVASNARERARDARCVGNLKQLHTAVMNRWTAGAGMPDTCSTEGRFGERDQNGNWNWIGWHQNNTGWVDWYNYDATAASTDTGNTTEHGDCKTYWYGPRGLRCNEAGSLWDWTGKSHGIYVCPTFQRRHRGPAPGNEEAVRSYVMNYARPGITSGRAYRTILFADGSYWETYDGNQVCRYGLRDTSNIQRTGGDGARRWYTAMDGMLQGSLWNAGRPEERVGTAHMGRGNVVFLDGHVEKVQYADTMDLCAGNWGDY